MNWSSKSSRVFTWELAESTSLPLFCECSKYGIYIIWKCFLTVYHNGWCLVWWGYSITGDKFLCFRQSCGGRKCVCFDQHIGNCDVFTGLKCLMYIHTYRMTKQRTYHSCIVFCPQYFEDYKLIDSVTGNRTEYAGNFLPYVGFASQIPNLLLNWINIILPLGTG